MPRFPKCDKCGANNWRRTEQRKLNSDLIDTYRCSPCGQVMSWGYRYEADALS